MTSRIASIIAKELSTTPPKIEAAINLLDEGNTVPFIARYRKEATGGLDDSQLRQIEERLVYLRELEARKRVVLEAIEEQGKLDQHLKALIEECDTKARLEDLYLPFKKRRKTKADKAREAGLEPLLDQLIAQPEAQAEALAEGYVGAEIADTKAALDGARAILIDRLALDADLVGQLRQKMYEEGQLRAKVIEGKQDLGAKYRDYFDFEEPFTQLPSHRILALLRGEQEGVLSLEMDAGDDAIFEQRIAEHAGLDTSSPWLHKAVHFAWRTKLQVSAGLDVRMRLKEFAQEQALDVFAKNLRDVLLAAPAGERATLGLDPGYRNGVKCAVVSSTGKVLETLIVYPHKPQQRWAEAVEQLATACATHRVELIAVGNGTASRESEKLAQEVADLIHKAGGQRPTPVVVSESGASVYSASALAAQEFPTMDVALRGAVSIARRLQDPLAELVKIDPKAIGVGQYQHDVQQQALARTLDAVVEDAVNAVGVDVNTASAPLLARVAGVTPSIAEHIVAYRDEHGAFEGREQLRKVPRLGPKAFEQSAGFLRVRGNNPLDASAVHPEAYGVVADMAAHTGLEVSALIANTSVLRSLDPQQFIRGDFGEPTIKDIIAELDKPGRDPRPEFKTAQFQEGVETLSDLREGMILEGAVTNVAAFGAFVDVGVHQDGLVHVSAMANHFVSDPHDVVRSGEVVKVKVLEVDVDRKRIALSMVLDQDSPQQRRGARPQAKADRQRGANPKHSAKPNARAKQSGKKQQRKQAPVANSAMAEALKRAGL